jgi:hypothetical protein
MDRNINYLRIGLFRMVFVYFRDDTNSQIMMACGINILTFTIIFVYNLKSNSLLIISETNVEM